MAAESPGAPASSPEPGDGPGGEGDRPPQARRVTRLQAGRDITGQLTFRLANLIVGVVTTLVLVRALGDAQFGEWVTVFAVIGLAGSFGLQGLGNVAVERSAGAPQDAHLWVGALVGLRLLLAPVVTAVSLTVCLWVASSTPMIVASIILNTILISTAFASARVVFQLGVRNTMVSAIDFASGVAWGIAVLILGVVGASLVPLAIAFAVVTNATNIVYYVASRRAMAFRLHRSRPVWRELVRRGVPLAFASLVTLGYGRIDQILVFELAGDVEAGFYGAAYRIYERLHLFPAAVMTTVFPVIVAARGIGAERIRKVVNTTVDYLVLVSLPALAISVVGPSEICALLFGSEFAAAGPALAILMASFVVISLGHLAGYLVISYELQTKFVLIALAALAFNVAGNLALVPTNGFVAAAWLTLATEVLVLVASFALLRSRLGFVPFGIRLGRVAAASLVVVAVGAGLKALGAPTLVWAALAGAVYLPALLALRVVRMSDLRGLARRRSRSEGSAAP